METDVAVMQKHLHTISNTDNSLISETDKNGSDVNSDHFDRTKTSLTCIIMIA